MSEHLRYNPHRKHRYWSQDHPPTAAQRRLVRRLDGIRRANGSDQAFGKINWAAYDHQQLWDMVQASDPATMGTTAHRWAQLAVDVDEVTGDVHQTVQKLLLSWRGSSAVTAAESASKLTKWGAGACDTMRDVGDGLDHYTSALLEARNHMPEPVYYSDVRHFYQGYDVKASNGPSAAILADQLLDDHLPTQHEASAAKAEAVRVMDRYEATSKHVHDRLPHFTDAPEPVDGPSGGTDRGTDWGTGGAADRGTGRGRETAPDGTVAASAVSVPGSDVGVPGGVGATGSALGGGSGIGSSISVGGGSTSGSGFGTGAASAVPGSAAAAAGRGAGPGGMGMYPPGAGAGHPGGGDGEHKNRYGEDRGLDLLDDLPPVYPPVLGE